MTWEKNGGGGVDPSSFLSVFLLFYLLQPLRPNSAPVPSFPSALSLFISLSLSLISVVPKWLSPPQLHFTPEGEKKAAKSLLSLRLPICGQKRDATKRKTVKGMHGFKILFSMYGGQDWGFTFTYST